MSEEDMALIVQFTDDSQSFTNGFEAGMLWARLEAGESPIDTREGVPMRSENETVITNMALHHQYDVQTFPTDHDGWLNYTLTKRPRVKGNFSLVTNTPEAGI